MLRRRTVFILGAGASRELDLPIGDDLKDWITDALKTNPNDSRQTFVDRHVEDAVVSYVSEVERSEQGLLYRRYCDAAPVISKALTFALSIDQYLDSQRADPVIVRLGKIGIAAAILKAEREGALGKARRTTTLRDMSRQFATNVKKSWHLKLVQLLTAGRAVEDAQNVFEDVAFIVFNYDRCLEHYLNMALSRYYNDHGIVQSAMQSLEVVHPYGQVGDMTWQHGLSIPFGGEAEGQLRRVADGILTFTESARSGVTDKVKRLIEEAETVVFMGFGYLPQNVDLLTARRRSDTARVFYTTCGISRSDSEFVDQDLEAILQKEAALPIHAGNSLDVFERFEEQGTCIDLMSNHWMRLTR